MSSDHEDFVPTQQQVDDAAAIFDELQPEQKRLQREVNAIKKRLAMPREVLRQHIRAQRLEEFVTPSGALIRCNRKRRARLSNKWLEKTRKVPKETKTKLLQAAVQDTERFTERQAPSRKRSRQSAD